MEVLSAGSEVIKQRIATEPYYVASKGVNNDLRLLESKYPYGIPDSEVAKALQIDEDEVHTWRSRLTTTIQRLMGVSE